MTYLLKTACAAALATAEPYPDSRNRPRHGDFIVLHREARAFEGGVSPFPTLADLQSEGRMRANLLAEGRGAARREADARLAFQPSCAFVYRAPFFGQAPAHRRSELQFPMTESTLSALVKAEAERLRKNAKRAASDLKARVGSALAAGRGKVQAASARLRFEAAEAARRARNGAAGGLAR